ncbi:MAG: TldD/PmbA family protein [Candidatus Eisenbacteria bacterium]|nr:TldD/PmbA family protein [Candidatus Eisenbacteria bacterium]
MRKKILWFSGVLLAVVAVSCASAAKQGDDLPSQLKVMKGELQRNFEALQKGENPPYYISYSINHVRSQSVSASFGAITYKNDDSEAYLNISVRVGSYALDNSHEIRGDQFARYQRMIPRSMRAPLADSPEALRVLLWQGTDKAYKDAVGMLAKIKTDRNLKVKEEDQSDDFSLAEPHVQIEKPLEITVDLNRWVEKVKKFSEPFKKNPNILESGAAFTSEVRNKYFVSSEGTILLTPVNYMRLRVTATAKAEDGMELPLYLSYFGYKESDLPSDSHVMAEVNQLIATLAALRDAPLVDPYTGPAVLSGKASGVFFHEILGHRLEGHRQKSEEEGQTFKKKVNEKVLPDFMSITFDPTIKEINGLKLSGYYEFDDEGTRAEKVVSIENGVLKGFLMSRSPIEKFPKSNGHARCQPGTEPVSRQSNLIVSSKKQLSEQELRQKLIDECKERGKPFGLVFKEIQGGMTMTGRMIPNAFTVIPILVYRVYVDGRPDQLVRGVDLIGTPLTTFDKIEATGSDIQVFNGMCGAESGSVPVSAASPSIFVSQIEVQKKEKSQDKPPILPPPSSVNE